MTIITLPTYQKHWIHTKPYGHDIVIWCDTGKTTIECRWQNTERDTNGRVKQKDRKDKRTETTTTTGATTMTDSFLSTKMKQLKNIQATVESTTGETQEMWITKWYQLIRSIAKEIESSS
jgi:predicted porin